MNQIYQTITNSIVTELERGAIPWIKPWKVTGIMPRNAVTQRAYTGINIAVLWMEAERRGYEHPLWLTYKQAQEANCQVRKGEKASQVIFVKKYTLKTDDGEEAQRGTMRLFSVFNVAQVDGYALPTPPEPMDRIQEADEVVQATGAKIQHGGTMAAYIPSMDYITMPAEHTFRGKEHYYATLFHELGHWSGPRLNRSLKGRFGDAEYAAEELVAELCAAFVSATVGISGDLRHAGYIQSWIKLLRDDPKAILKAASEAQRAADFILNPQ